MGGRKQHPYVFIISFNAIIQSYRIDSEYAKETYKKNVHFVLQEGR